MRADSGRWTEVAASRHPHEREGLEHVRDQLPDAAPYHAWSNVEFVALDGTPYEVDLVVLGPAGFHLVELKAWSGKIEQDRSGGENDWLSTLPAVAALSNGDVRAAVSETLRYKQRSEGYHGGAALAESTIPFVVLARRGAGVPWYKTVDRWLRVVGRASPA